MHGTSAGHALGEVLIGAAFGSPGQPSATSWREGVDMDFVPEELVQRWEAVYGRYLSAPADRAKMARLSTEVAAAWREIAAVPGLTWWTVAALRTAAEAFERQASMPPQPLGRPTERGSGPETWFRSSDR
jgi:hypothetical protein